MHSVPEKSKLLILSYCAILCIVGFQLGGFQLVLLSAIDELGISRAMIGLPITAQFISLCTMPLIFGPISDRFGKKLIIVIFIFIFVIGCLFVWQSGTVIIFLAGAFIIGTGASVCDCSVNASILDVFTGEEEKYMNFALSFFSIGAVISPLLMQALMDNFSASWRLTFLISAAAMAAVLPVIMLVRTTTGPVSKHPRKKQKIENPRLFLGFTICVFLYVSIEACLAFFADTIFTIELNFPAFGAWAISLFWGAMGAGRLFLGRLKNIPRHAIVVSLFCLALIIGGIILNRNEIVMLVLFAVAGFACSCIWPGIVNAAVALNRTDSGALMSYLNLSGGIGGSAIPLAVGVIMDAANFSVSFLVLIVFSVIAGVYMLKKSIVQ